MLRLFSVEVVASPRGAGLALKTYRTTRRQLEQERGAPGTTENHQNGGSRDTTPVGQSGTPRTGSEDASITPGVAVLTPSTAGGGRIGCKG